MAGRTLKIGIISREEYKRRTIAIARGDYKPKRNEPKIWFESLRSMSRVFGGDNRDLLRIIKTHEAFTEAGDI